MQRCRQQETRHVSDGRDNFGMVRRESVMVADGTIVPVLAIIFFATLIRSALGFGEALVAVPLLVFVMPAEVAAPLAVLVSITIAAGIVVQDWHKIHVRS